MGSDDQDAKPRPRPRPSSADDNGATKRRKLGRFFDTGDGDAAVPPRPIAHFPGIPPPDQAAAQEPERPRPSPAPRRPRPSGGQ